MKKRLCMRGRWGDANRKHKSVKFFFKKKQQKKRERKEEEIRIKIDEKQNKKKGRGREGERDGGGGGGGLNNRLLSAPWHTSVYPGDVHVPALVMDGHENSANWAAVCQFFIFFFAAGLKPSLPASRFCVARRSRWTAATEKWSWTRTWPPAAPLDQERALLSPSLALSPFCCSLSTAVFLFSLSALSCTCLQTVSLYCLLWKHRCQSYLVCVTCVRTLGLGSCEGRCLC